ncbi:aldose 1-epimerase family protein [Actinobacillus arthritidis]|uniref:aldose 1-epimerase family protein n=1 Tax=Actinobacillus arthritidis TaxID=157339 RepID=UPI002441CF72|nr:aldose 1-epimerase family protein [Actinobacillus arthritidis]WGE89164.1 aldose 1-epimerase family protein [Actinobacillus arthritidis]
MKNYIYLLKEQFNREEQIIFENETLKAVSFKYNSGVEAIKLINSKGFITVLPFYGQIIWDAEFNGQTLKMKNMFSEPKQGTSIIDTYGCFAFHSGLIRNGRPSPEDDHRLHGEMPCARMDKAWLVFDEDSLSVGGSFEYVKGFGDHYLAQPEVTLRKDSSMFDIKMNITNLASVEMPLQYMCHMNYCYEHGATFSQNIPDNAIQLRQTIPGHVKPTPQWLAFNEEIKQGKYVLSSLDNDEMYNPEIVFFMDNLQQYQANLEYRMHSPKGYNYLTKFSSKEFNYATRWILYNADQQVGAFVLPATCRPEGYLVAKKANTLIIMKPHETKSFKVTTGIEE